MSSLYSKALHRLMFLPLLFLASACSTEQAYNSLKGWQKNECNKRIDNVEREKCLRDAGDTNYDEYKKQTSQ